MNICKKTVFASVGALLLAAPGIVMAGPVLVMEVYGLYCKVCFAGARNEMLRQHGVSKVHVYFKDGKVVVIPKGSIKNLPVAAVKGIVRKSSYTLKGSWICNSTNLSVSTKHSVPGCRSV